MRVYVYVYVCVCVCVRMRWRLDVLATKEVIALSCDRRSSGKEGKCHGRDPLPRARRQAQQGMPVRALCVRVRVCVCTCAYVCWPGAIDERRRTSEREKGVS